MAYTYITDRYHRVRQIEISDDDPLVTDARKRFFAMKMRDREMARQDALDHSKGYCPKCHTLLPLSGVCGNCD